MYLTINLNLERVLALALVLLILGISNTNHAMVTSLNTQSKIISLAENNQKELSYCFFVADKLEGIGEIKLQVEKNNKLKGIASGIGMTEKCDIDFHSNFDGVVNSKNGTVKVEIKGIGNPLKVLLPGKVTYHGPLTGELKDGKLSLSGKVYIKGGLAKYAGFNDAEDLQIEITTIPKAKEKLASL